LLTKLRKRSQKIRSADQRSSLSFHGICPATAGRPIARHVGAAMQLSIAAPCVCWKAHLVGSALPLVDGERRCPEVWIASARRQRRQVALAVRKEKTQSTASTSHTRTTAPTQAAVHSLPRNWRLLIQRAAAVVVYLPCPTCPKSTLDRATPCCFGGRTARSHYY